MAAARGKKVPVKYFRWVGGAETPTPKGTKTCFDSSDVPWGGHVRVHAQASGGWVFCGMEDGGCGEMLTIIGGSLSEKERLTGDEAECSFKITHDGKSDTVVIRYNTRAD